MANIIVNLVTKGVQKTKQGIQGVAKATDNLNKSQTRLAQSSASAGRAFSAQANGLGGMVAAYAGAAATIFAVQQAFSALSAAAKSEQITEGTRTLALQLGESGDAILKSIQEITKSQLTLVDTAANVNAALSAGFNKEQIEELSTIALKVSRALGRDLTDAFNRLVKGAGKLEPELLDELGIFTRIDPAVRKYAAAMNIAESSVTAFEKRQAFVNEVIDEGNKKFKEINTTSETSAESLEKFASSIINLATEIGAGLANTLQPLINFFSQDFGNALAVGLLLGTQIFGVLRRELVNFSQVAVAKINSVSDSITNLIQKFDSGNAKGLALRSGFDSKIFANTGAFGGGKDRASIGKDVKSQLKNLNNLTVREIKDLNTELKNQVDIERKARPTMEDKVKAGKLNANSLAVQSKRQAALSAAVKRTDLILRSTSKTATVASKGFKVLSVSVNLAAAAFSKLLGAINVIAFGLSALQFVGSFFDVDIIGGITDAIGSIGKEGRERAKVAESIADFVIAKDGEDIMTLLRARTKKVEEDISEEIKRTHNKIRESFEARAASGDNSLISIAPGASAEEAVAAQIINRRRALAALNTEINSLSKSSQLSAGTITDLADRGFVKAAEKGKEATLSILGFNIAIKEGTEGLQSAGVFAASAMVAYEEAAASANTRAEDLAKVVNRLGKAVKDLREEGGERGLLRALIGEEADAQALLRFVSAQETLQTNIRKQSNSSLTLADRLISSGSISLDGSITTDSRQGKAELFADLKKQQELIEAQGTDLAKVQAITNTINLLNKVQLGDMIKIGREQEKQLKDLDKQIASQIRQSNIQEAGLQVARAQEAIQLRIASDTKNINKLKSEVTLMEQQLRLVEAQTNALAAQAEILKEFSSERNSRNRGSSNRSLDNLRNRQEILRNEAEKAQNILRSSFAKEDAGTIFGPSNSDLGKRESKLLQIQIEALKDIQKLDMSILAQEQDIALQEIAAKRKILQEEKAELRFKLFSEKANQARQEIIIQKQNTIKGEELSNELSILQQQAALIELERENALVRSESAEADKLAGLDNIKLRLDILAQEANMLSDFLKGLGELLKPIINESRERAGEAALTQEGIENIVKKVAIANPADLASRFRAIRENTVSSGLREREGINASFDNRAGTNSINQSDVNQRVSSLQKIIELEQQQRKEANKSAIEKLEGEIAVRNSREVTLDRETENITQQFAERGIILEQNHELEVKNLKTQQAAAKQASNIFRELATAIGEDLKGAFGDFFNTVFTEVLQGSKTIGEAMRDLFSNILTNIIEQITQKLIVENLVKAGSSIFSSLFFASGGHVRQMASGGLLEAFASGGSKRDSVPAMLEPGEFVMRKRAVQQVGVNNLRDMNRGNGGGQQAPQINIINKGTPQTTEGQPKIEFNGKQLVVDIITTDMRNNGPIRKSMQGLRN